LEARIREEGADSPREPVRISRRRLVGSGLFAAGAAAGLGASRLDGGDAEERRADGAHVEFHGAHQAGIATPPQRHMVFAAFDFGGERADELRELLAAWSAVGARLTRGEPARGDTGEALGLEPASLTLTFGLGPELFERDGDDRLGLAARRPAPLRQIDGLAGETLEATRSGGDLAVQACADDAQVAFNAVHNLARVGRGAATLRWLQVGFSEAVGQGPRRTPRNLMGFKDGTNNLPAGDEREMLRHVWVGGADAPAWMRGGTYVVARRIRMLLDVWDSTSVEEQERTIGRAKTSGAPLGARREHDRVDLAAQSAAGPAVPADAHIRLAAPSSNGGARILRRGYSYADGVDAATDQLDAGLFFISFQRDPGKQFVPMLRRLHQHDALNKHLMHTASAVFACPPGARPRGYVGEGLFSA
jgi:deferrochelatase/peroxidase EfeB